MDIKGSLKPILFFIIVGLIILLFLGILRTQIERYPGLVSVASDYVQSHGLWGGFLISFTGSQWFIPFPYEVVLVSVLKLYKPMFLALIVFVLGASLADVMNFYTGRKLGESYIKKKIKKKTLENIRNFFTKYGIATLLIFGFIGPITSYDIVTFAVGGFSRIKFRVFFPLTVMCRFINFAVILFFANVLLKIAGISL